MPYQMTIGCDINGTPLIGARTCREHNAVVEDYIYPSQMAYRVVAWDGHGYCITTRTDATQAGWVIGAEFPRADGSLSAR